MEKLESVVQIVSTSVKYDLLIMTHEFRQMHFLPSVVTQMRVISSNHFK